MHQVTKLADLLKSREHLGIRPEHAVDFVIRARQCGGIVQQRVDREGQHATGRLMSRDQKGDYLVADIGVVQRATGLLVDPRQHVVEQVWVVRQIGTGSPAFADQPVDHAVHVFDIAGEAAIAPVILSRSSPGRRRICCIAPSRASTIASTNGWAVSR